MPESVQKRLGPQGGGWVFAFAVLNGLGFMARTNSFIYFLIPCLFIVVGGFCVVLFARKEAQWRLRGFGTIVLNGILTLVVTFGISSRPSKAAVRIARQFGIKAGMFRLKTIWPFPEDEIREMAERVHGFVVPEINEGQIALEVERIVHGKCEVRHVGCGGRIHHPDEIRIAIEEVEK